MKAASMFLLASLLALPGCVFVAGAAIGAGIVAATSEDTAQVDLDARVADVFATAVGVVERRGEVTGSSERSGEVEGNVGNSSVDVSVFAVNEFTRVRVTARKLVGALPDLSLAEDIAREIGHAHP